MHSHRTNPPDQRGEAVGQDSKLSRFGEGKSDAQPRRTGPDLTWEAFTNSGDYDSYINKCPDGLGSEGAKAMAWVNWERAQQSAC